MLVAREKRFSADQVGFVQEEQNGRGISGRGHCMRANDGAKELVLTFGKVQELT